MKSPMTIIVSVGMVDHVGTDNLRQYLCEVFSLLNYGGVFLNQGIKLRHDEFK